MSIVSVLINDVLVLSQILSKTCQGSWIVLWILGHLVNLLLHRVHRLTLTVDTIHDDGPRIGHIDPGSLAKEFLGHYLHGRIYDPDARLATNGRRVATLTDYSSKLLSTVESPVLAAVRRVHNAGHQTKLDRA